MKFGPWSEIKVALLGHVSVGKTTVLNAILGDQFGEVSMRRTTAGINFFRIVSSDEATGESDKWSVAGQKEDIKAADKIHQEISKSNKKLREAQKIEEKWFNVGCKPLCEMRKETSLVVVDIPGINEADSNNIYMNYVQENWKTFDCVVVVMDARQGVNTEEQVGLLRFVKDNLSKKKNLPVIVLFNKVDEPDDTEQALLVKESQAKISSMFGVGCRAKALKQLPTLSGKKGVKHSVPTSKLYPVVIPVSAIRAYFYRAASSLPFEEFRKKFDQDIIEKIGREEMNRNKWRKMSVDKKYKALYDLVVEGSEDEEDGIQGTGFDTFLCALSVSVGGQETQTKLLQNQVDIALQSFQDEKPSCSQFMALHETSKALDKDMGAIKRAFWTKYTSCKESSLDAFRKEPKVEVMAEPVALLKEYSSFVTSVVWEDEAKLVAKSFYDLVSEQIGVIVNKQDLQSAVMIGETGTCNSFWEENCPSCDGQPVAQSQQEGDTKDGTWGSFSVYDWVTIFESVKQNLPSSPFSQELIVLGILKDKYASSLGTSKLVKCACSTCYNELQRLSGSNGRKTISGRRYRCGCRYPGSNKCQKTHHSKEGWDVSFDRGKLKVVGSLANVQVPSTPSDKQHWGHVAWCCKNQMESEGQP